MNKRFLFLVMLTLLFSCLSSSIVAQKKRSPKITVPTTKAQSVVEIEDVTFDKQTAISWCPINISGDLPCSKDKQLINITTILKNKGSEEPTYYYNVSGGQISGSGANVTWNFAGVELGKYTITIGIGKNGIIHGNTITKTINLQECPDCDIGCECPTITVTEPTEPARAGDSAIFTANVTRGYEKASYTYKWTVSTGTIISGQGTAQIIVKSNPNVKETNITATVELGGACADCPNTASGTVTVSDSQP